MKLSEAKSIGKKIILVAFCLILFLIFTALSYAKPDPKYIFQEDPWQHVLSSKLDNNQNLELVILVINPHFYLIFKSPCRAENFRNLTETTNQKSDNSIKHNPLNRDETNSKK